MTSVHRSRTTCDVGFSTSTIVQYVGEHLCTADTTIVSTICLQKGLGVCESVLGRLKKPNKDYRKIRDSLCSELTKRKFWQ